MVPDDSQSGSSAPPGGSGRGSGSPTMTSSVSGSLSARPIRRMTRMLRKRSAAVTAPLGFQLLGRMLLHAALVGAAAGLIGSLFVAGLELAQRGLLEGLTGYLPLKAAGELVFPDNPAPWRPWLLCLIPAAGALVGGAVSRIAPETRGGGADAIIESFHK